MKQILLFALLVILPSCRSNTTSTLKVTCIDVGQGDSVLLTFPNGRHWLVDAGGKPAGDTESGMDPGHRNVLPVLRAMAIQSLDVVVMTHPDEDHVQGMLAIARHIPVRQVYWNGFVGSTTEQRVRTMFKLRGTDIKTVSFGDQMKVGNVRVDVLGPPKRLIFSTRSPENENSVILLLSFGRKSVLLTGDVEAEGEGALLRKSRPSIRSLSLLKVAHHGSDSSSIQDFVQCTHPRVAFISCGKRNRYGHPSMDVIKRLKNVGTDVYRTDDCGMLEWSSDGMHETVSSMLPCNKNALR